MNKDFGHVFLKKRRLKIKRLILVELNFNLALKASNFEFDAED